MKLTRRLQNLLGVRTVRIQSTPPRLEPKRYAYQQQYLDFGVKPGDKVIDIGSGGDPFPLATHLCDLNIGETPDRHEPLVRDERPFCVADIHNLPFEDKSFDFAYCCHVLEHARDPIVACREVQRIALRGYIETPTFGKDVLFSWARGVHRWHVVGHGHSLIFFEYTDRQLDGCRSTYWRDLIHAKTYSPLQDLFCDNQDVFNTMFLWNNGFRVEVFRNGIYAPEVYEP